MELTLQKHPHRRYNPLTGEWVQVSPHRMERPWQGKVENIAPIRSPIYDPNCYLCPGNPRAGGITNPEYRGTYVFTNDFSALLPDGPSSLSQQNQLLQAESNKGTCRVICFSHRHDLTLPEMKLEEILQIVDLWADQSEELGHSYAWVQVFENKGSLMGCSNSHPHGQIWALDTLPNEPAKEDACQLRYHEHYSFPLLCSYLEVEEREKTRIVIENEHWLVVVPFWGIWPYETVLLPRFDPVFHLVPPSGELLTLRELQAGLQRSHATNPELRITVRNVKVHRVLNDFVLATYEEWQRSTSASTSSNSARISSVVFHGTRTLRWLHVHETWLPDARP